jgi:indole-3-glycerol phosphate synthase
VILDEILASKRAEVAARKVERPAASLRPPPDHAPRPFASPLRQPDGVRVIAEIKRKSPSGGELRPGASAADLAAEYGAHGAAALSVLTDFPYFGGTDDDLVSARATCDIPVLRKDFVIDPYQVHEAHALGADAVLLIVRALASSELTALLSLTHELGMDALVETHSADEIQRALEAGARIVGVNNRDLDTLVTDPSLALRLRALVPPDCIFVAESGVSTSDQIAALREIHADAVLIGEALVRAPHPGAKLRELVAVGSGPGVAPVRVAS